MAYMGFHKAMHPSMIAVRTATPATSSQIVFRALTRDRWKVNTDLTRCKNHVQQMFSVTNPELKSIFSQPGRTEVMRLALEYPTAKDMAKASEEELRTALIKARATKIASKAAKELKALLTNSIAVDASHLVGMQNWLIKESLRLQESIDQIDEQIHDLLFGNTEKEIQAHPYTDILFSFPFMSDNWACTLIGIIGDVNRFNLYSAFKKFRVCSRRCTVGNISE